MLSPSVDSYQIIWSYVDILIISLSAPDFPLLAFWFSRTPCQICSFTWAKFFLPTGFIQWKHSYHPFVNWCIWNQPDKSFKLFSILAAYIFHHVFWANFPALLCVPFIVRDLIFSWDNHRGADSKFSERVFRNLKYALENSFEVNWTYFIIGNVLYFREQRCPANHKWASVMSIR